METKTLRMDDRRGVDLIATRKEGSMFVAVNDHGNEELATILLTKSKAMSLGWWLLTNAAEMEDD